MINPTENLRIEAIQKNDVQQQLNEDFYFPYMPNGTLSDLCCIHKSDRDNAINDLAVITPIQLKTTKDWKLLYKSSANPGVRFDVSDRYVNQLIICSVAADTLNNVEKRFLCVDGSAIILKGRTKIAGSYESLKQYGEWITGKELAQWILKFKHYRILQSVCRTPQPYTNQIERVGIKTWTPVDIQHASIKECFRPSPLLWTPALNSNGYEQEGMKHDVECYLPSELMTKWKFQIKTAHKPEANLGFTVNIRPKKGCYHEGDWDFIMVIIPPINFDIKAAYNDSEWCFAYIISWKVCLQRGIGGDNGKLSACLYPPGTRVGKKKRDTWANEYLIDRNVQGWRDRMIHIIKTC